MWAEYHIFFPHLVLKSLPIHTLLSVREAINVCNALGSFDKKKVQLYIINIIMVLDLVIGPIMLPLGIPYEISHMSLTYENGPFDKQVFDQKQFSLNVNRGKLD